MLFINMQKLVINAWKIVILRWFEVAWKYIATSQFSEGFVENYIEDSDEGYFLEVEVQFPEKLYHLHNDLPLLPGRMIIEKVEKLVANVHDKKEY